MIREKIKALRKEATELESRGVEEERREAYVSALRAERRSVEHSLAVAVRLGDKRERIPDPFSPGGFTEGERTGTEIAAHLNERLAAIDTELQRVTSAP